MKKQYMDFVPAGKQMKKTTLATAKPAVNGGLKVAAQPTASTTKSATMHFAGEAAPKLGRVENLNQRFVKTEVAKRPLSAQKQLAAVKAQRIGNQAPMKPVAKKVAPAANAQAPAPKLAKIETYEPPKNKFINLSKVEKRPLSKNVYAKKVEAPVEKPQGPITIISKPEKQNHAGLIITVIITIILGAAAGTVAFMLLPK